MLQSPSITPISAMRMCSERRRRVALKKFVWVALWVQLFCICLLTLSLRDDASRRSLFLRSNLASPISAAAATAVAVATHSSSGGNATSTPIISGVKRRGNEKTFTAPGKNRRWKFKRFDLSAWNAAPKVEMGTDDAGDYFRELSTGQVCFTLGTDFSKLKNITERSQHCPCKPNYFGADCGIPEAAWFGHYKGRSTKHGKLRRRKKLRRIVHATLANHEFDFFEARVRSLADVVDAFIVQESNFTTFGSPKSLEFLTQFRRGWLWKHQDKIAYVFLGHFTEKGRTNGWYADSYLRTHLSRQGLRLVSGLRDDDIFLYLDADELPTREMLLFLKVYDGYSEPIRFGFRWTVFGFYWLKALDPSIMDLFFKKESQERLLELYVACTVGMLRIVYGHNAMLLRRNVWSDPLLADRLTNYTSNTTSPSLSNIVKRVREWTAGTMGHYAGYHCSWCYQPEGIRTKLLSAQKHDSPRWGDYPEKTNLTYIAGLIENGEWFDGTAPFISVRDEEESTFYAPEFFLKRREKYRYLLDVPHSN